jgi:NADH-quinone oxidoreductase subunit D
MKDYLELDAPIPEEPRELRTEVMTLNVGPQHPSTHGVLRLVVTLSGEEVLEVVPHVGYLHTGFEKNMEHRTYLQNLTYTPRMDYLHSVAHDLAYALAVEKLVGAVVPKRAETIRIILNELSRLASHLVFLGTGLLDLGALTPFFYAFREREAILDLFEWVTGQRFHHNYIRIGGVKEDLPEEFVPELKKLLEVLPHRIDEYEALFAESPIFHERARDVGVIPPEVAINLGLTGGSLRASGVNYDVRKAYPYGGYETYQFDVPLGERGDVFDRMLIRIREMRESVKILKQALERLEPGPVRDPNPQITPPPGPSWRPPWRRSSTTSSTTPRASTPPRGRSTCPRSRPGGAGLLHRLRRGKHALPGQGAGPELRQPAKPPLRLQGGAGARHGGHHRQPGPRDGDVDR